jgi:hypothetical protein
MASAHPTTTPPINARWKVGIAVVAVLLLSAPSAVGVYRALNPTRGTIAAGLAAAGFELAYLSLSLLTLRPALRQQARAVALGAVITAIGLNGLADYAHRVIGGLASWAAAQHLFDPLALILSLAESAPLAGLAFALASLLHRLAEEQRDGHGSDSDETPAADSRVVWARDEITAPELVSWAGIEEPRDNGDSVAGNTSNVPATIYRCRHCGAEGLTKGEQLEHGRRHARERKAQ